MSDLRRPAQGTTQNLKSTPGVARTPESSREPLRNPRRPGEGTFHHHLLSPPASFPLQASGQQQAGLGEGEGSQGRSGREMGLISCAA